MSDIVAYSKFNPFRRVDWRYERVLGMVDREDGKLGRCTHKDDRYVKGLRNFILRFRAIKNDRDRNTLSEENPGLYMAWLYNMNRDTDGGRRLVVMVEARILAGQDDETIAEEMTLAPKSIEWFEALFFCVRDRRNACDWIVSQVLIPSVMAASESSAARTAEEQRMAREGATEETGAAAARRRRNFISLTELTDPFQDVTVKFVGYFGGVHVLDFALGLYERGNLANSKKEVSAWHDAHLSARSRQRSSNTISVMPIDRDNAMQLLNLHARLIEIDRSSDTAENKEDKYHNAIKAVIKEIPWAVGTAGRALVAGTSVEKFDDGGMKLRDSELQLCAAGETPDNIEIVDSVEVFRPRPKLTAQIRGKEVK